MRGLSEIFTLRAMDIVLCFPPLLLAMLAVTLYGPGPITLIPVLSVVFVPGFTRVAYASVLTVRSQDYVEAVRAMGASNGRIMVKTILPNIMALCWSRQASSPRPPSFWNRVFRFSDWGSYRPPRRWD